MALLENIIDGDPLDLEGVLDPAVSDAAGSESELPVAPDQQNVTTTEHTPDETASNETGIADPETDPSQTEDADAASTPAPLIGGSLVADDDPQTELETPLFVDPLATGGGDLVSAGVEPDTDDGDDARDDEIELIEARLAAEAESTTTADDTGPSGSDPDPGVGDPVDPTAPADADLNLVGTSGADTLEGGSGNDTLDGGFGNDIILGGAGNDRLLGNVGDDRIEGGDGDDYAFGSSGADWILGGNGNDELRGGFHNDVLEGGAGDDYLNGWTGNDTLSGGDGNDTMDGGDDHDLYIIDGGAPGDIDIITDSSGDDVLWFDGINPFEAVSTVEQIGDDLVFNYTGGGSLTVQNFYGAGAIEILRYDGTDYATNADATSALTFDEFINGTDDQILNGTADADVITGGIGNDQIAGKAGNDNLSGAAGDDAITGGDGVDTLHGGDGNDTLYGAGDGALDFYSADVLYGDAGMDTLYGGGGNDILYGGAENDRILGEAGDDIGYGEDGDDYLFGDFGNDTLSGGDGNDEIRGGFNNDILSGDAGDDFLHGYHGNDVMEGGTGSDRMEGGDGNDVFIMKRGNGTDVISDFTAFSAGAVYADTVDLSDFGIASFSDLVMSEVGGDTTIDLGGGDSLTFENVGISGLGADDFTF